MELLELYLLYFGSHHPAQDAHSVRGDALHSKGNFTAGFLSMCPPQDSRYLYGGGVSFDPFLVPETRLVVPSLVHCETLFIQKPGLRKKNKNSSCMVFYAERIQFARTLAVTLC